MSVYIEYAIIDNLIIDYLLLKSTFYIIKQKVKILRIILTAVLGTVTAILLPLTGLNALLNFFIKILLAFVMIFLAGEYKSIRAYFLALSVFLALTFVSGGAVIAMLYALNLDFVFKNASISYKAEIPLSAIILIAVIITKICVKIAHSVYKKKNIFPFIRKTEIIVKGKPFSMTGFIDSGNRLFDKKTGSPIIIISEKTFKKLNMMFYVGKPYGKLDFSTVSGDGQMPVYSIDEVIVYGVEKIVYDYVYLGVSKMVYTGDYDVILHPAIINV